LTLRPSGLTLPLCAMTPQDLLRWARDLESQGLDHAAEELRWAAASRAPGVKRLTCPQRQRGAYPSATEPAADPEFDRESDPLCVLESALLDAESVGDLATVSALLGVLAGLPAAGRRAA